MSRGKVWWDKWFLGLANYISTASKDPSTKVGAVIVDDHRRVVGIGYNGFPRGVHDDKQRYDTREVKYELVVHAEANAILNAARTEGCTLYATFFPCPHCAALIIQAGIRHVVALPSPSDERYRERRALSEQMLKEAGVTFE